MFHVRRAASETPGAPSHPRLTVAVALLLLSLVAAFSPARAEELPDPTKPGPYPVGVTTMVLEDWSRVSEKDGRPRSLLTEIWYPATDEARSLPKNRFSDFILRDAVPDIRDRVREFFKVSVEEVDARYRNEARRDAIIRDGKWPLLVFSHGNGGIRSQSTFWCDHMASHGYVIMSCDHTGNSAVTVVDGKAVVFQAGATIAAAKDRPLDAVFLIDRMFKMAGEGADSRFNGRVDLERIGMAGHSFGGFTSAAVIDVDPRVDAIIPMTPVWPKRVNFTTPVMILLATEDDTIGLAGNNLVRRRFAESRGPHYMIDLIRGGHFTFTDIWQFDPEYGDGVGKGKKITTPGEDVEYLDLPTAFEIANSYSVAFFGVYVKGQEGYREYLEENHYPTEVVHEFGRGEGG